MGTCFSCCWSQDRRIGYTKNELVPDIIKILDDENEQNNLTFGTPGHAPSHVLDELRVALENDPRLASRNLDIAIKYKDFIPHNVQSRFATSVTGGVFGTHYYVITFEPRGNNNATSLKSDTESYYSDTASNSS